ncbi:Crp/Fnr family transcriptional regulator [Chitinophaga polysaccharea]|uniref:Crp/Fnr family transcriptional regulator n=1 Tax=Chitinophaga TaxID=79328 RepID=UPI001455B2E3|nr:MULTISPECIES: Crp/Fnr family transcriptional regulator [Chitinophaga]NLR61624.1 Crp/Fnr family transcriptional regulator [Chitinophaga polysaccharea]NLU93781.1 Crp/Fnr family transcriptional regulator [Chitinophaga sp. Ak27]
MMKATSSHLSENLCHIASLTPDAMQLLIDNANTEVVNKGDYLLREGQRCQCIWFIENGACRAFHDKDAREINTAFYFENTFFTDMKSLRNNTSTEYNLQAMEKTILWKWHKDTLSHLYQLSPEITAFGRQWLEHLLIVQETHIQWLTKNTPEERYQAILTHHPELVQRVPLTQLCSYLGISRETLSRIRRRLQ